MNAPKTRHASILGILGLATVVALGCTAPAGGAEPASTTPDGPATVAPASTVPADSGKPSGGGYPEDDYEYSAP